MVRTTRPAMETGPLEKVKQKMDSRNHQKAVECGMGHVGAMKQSIAQIGPK